MDLAGHVAHMAEMKNSYKILVGKTEGKRLLGILVPSCERNIRIILREIWSEGVGWKHLAQYIGGLL
jgi:hypothetical protein